MKKTLSVMVMVVAMALSLVGTALADGHPPSTNEINEANGWAHFTVIDDNVPGQVTVEFDNPRNFLSCFEHRSDGEAPDSGVNGNVNFNPEITDGLWEYVCVNGETKERTILADSLVEIRLTFGAEADERFDWTPIEVTEVPKTKQDCKDGGWETFGDYKNQGQCVSEFARS